MICFDDHTRHDDAHKRLAQAFFEPDFQKHIKDYFTKTTQFMLKKHVLAFSNSSRRQIDVVRDVCNVVPTLWVAQKIGIPIKSSETPHGIMSAAELRLVLVSNLMHLLSIASTYQSDDVFILFPCCFSSSSSSSSGSLSTSSLPPTSA